MAVIFILRVASIYVVVSTKSKYTAKKCPVLCCFYFMEIPFVEFPLKCTCMYTLCRRVTRRVTLKGSALLYSWFFSFIEIPSVEFPLKMYMHVYPLQNLTERAVLAGRLGTPYSASDNQYG